MTAIERLLIWEIDETRGFDTAWARVDGSQLRAEGHAAGLEPPFSSTYTVETDEHGLTTRVHAEVRSADGVATVDLRRTDAGWTVDGELRPDLDGALDCDLAFCPLTNTMPVLRHRLLDEPGDHELLMAFIEIPSLEVVPSRQQYTHVSAATDDQPATVRFRSGSFESLVTFDADGFVIDYPQLGRRLRAGGGPTT